MSGIVRTPFAPSTVLLAGGRANERPVHLLQDRKEALGNHLHVFLGAAHVIEPTQQVRQMVGQLFVAGNAATVECRSHLRHERASLIVLSEQVVADVQRAARVEVECARVQLLAFANVKRLKRGQPLAQVPCRVRIASAALGEPRPTCGKGALVGIGEHGCQRRVARAVAHGRTSLLRCGALGCEDHVQLPRTGCSTKPKPVSPLARRTSSLSICSACSRWDGGNTYRSFSVGRLVSR